jgi:hypothetical protein
MMESDLHQDGMLQHIILIDNLLKLYLILLKYFIQALTNSKRLPMSARSMSKFTVLMLLLKNL